jgi:hypothetical protein
LQTDCSTAGVAEQSEHALGFADWDLEVTRVALGNFLKAKNYGGS